MKMMGMSTRAFSHQLLQLQPVDLGESQVEHETGRHVARRVLEEL
jgi:hypothetical protein